MEVVVVAIELVIGGGAGMLELCTAGALKEAGVEEAGAGSGLGALPEEAPPKVLQHH